jgi:cystathionine beta-lyase/cystathionine gamma-synthase
LELGLGRKPIPNEDRKLESPPPEQALSVPKDIRLQNEITNGLLRKLVGIKNVCDIVANLEQAT